MALQKIINETYQVEQIDVFKVESEIFNKLKQYVVPKSSESNFPTEPRYGMEKGWGDGLYFNIPSLNASLSSHITFDSKGRNRGGGKIYDFSNPSEFTSQLEIIFSYLKDTSQKDLDFVRNVLIKKGLNKILEN
jgi:hypothetical protein